MFSSVACLDLSLLWRNKAPKTSAIKQRIPPSTLMITVEEEPPIVLGTEVKGYTGRAGNDLHLFC